MAGGYVSEYHVQAAIAATRARAIGRSCRMAVDSHLCDQLLSINASPVVALNRAVAVSKVHGPAEALASVGPLASDPKLRDYYLLLAVRGHLLIQLRRPAEAAECFRSALKCGCSEPGRRFLKRQLEQC